MQKSDFKKSQTVYLQILPGSDASRSISDKTDTKAWVKNAAVKSVGRQYITVDLNGRDIKFDIDDNFKQVIDRGSIDYSLHLSEQSALDAGEQHRLFILCQNAFGWHNRKAYSLSQLRDIINIIDGGKTDWKDRFKSEYAQLTDRIAKLDAMLRSWNADTLNFQPKSPKHVYELQLAAMRCYTGCLEYRAETDNIPL